MKRSLIAFAASATVVALAVQLSLPASLAGHVAKLKEAKGLKVKVTVNEVGGAPTVYELSYGREDMLRIETQTELVVSDGRTLTVLDKAKNTYVQKNVTKDVLAQHATAIGPWGWASFFEADPAKLFKSARAGAARKLRGVDVTEVETTLADGTSTATLYVEPKTGVVRGYQLKKAGKEYIAWAESVALSATAPAQAGFAFAAPDGAKKVEEGAVGDVNWATIGSIFARKCMPCHSPGIRSGNLELSTYDGAAKNQFVISGNSKISPLALALRAAGPKRMPQGRPPLPESEIKAVEAWIDGGLKQ